MPFLGLGLHVLIAILFAVHAVRSGQPYYWLFILFSFPLLGSIVYFVVVFLPHWRLDRGARLAVAAAGRALDPGRELREARAAFEYTPTAGNRMRLANAQLEAGQYALAAASYEASLEGLFAKDPDIRFGAARAHVAAGQLQPALAHLEILRSEYPEFRAEAVGLLRARALTSAGRQADAGAVLADLVDRFGSFETKAEYLIWAVDARETILAGALRGDLERTLQHWPRHTRELHRDLLRRLAAATATLS
ncbi:MAG: hypothetical protein KGI67_07425 [Pseudomonadota bacterium]|nr:hypothetical protein [Pseudomonadota bacterium]